MNDANGDDSADDERPTAPTAGRKDRQENIIDNDVKYIFLLVVFTATY